MRLHKSGWDLCSRDLRRARLIEASVVLDQGVHRGAGESAKWCLSRRVGASSPCCRNPCLGNDSCPLANSTVCLSDQELACGWSDLPPMLALCKMGRPNQLDVSDISPPGVSKEPSYVLTDNGIDAGEVQRKSGRQGPASFDRHANCLPRT